MKRKILFILTLTMIMSGLGLSTQTLAQPRVNVAPATLTLGGLFPLTGTLSSGGVERDAAARMAVKEINADSDLLPDTTIDFLVRDTATVPATGTTVATEVIGLGAVGIVGAASSSVSKAVAEVGETNQVPVISYSSTNADLSKKADYPYFLRVVPPDSVQGVALAGILYDLGIKEVATLSTNDDYGSGGINVFKTAFTDLGGTIATAQQFAQGASDVLTQLQAIVDSKATVIVLNTIVGDAKTVFNQAADVGITPEDGYQWVGTDGSTQDQIFTDESNVVDTALRAATKGMFGTAPNAGVGAVYSSFLDLWETCYGSDTSEYAGCGDRSPNTYATYAYDAVYAFAYAAQNMIDAGDDPTDDGPGLLAELAGLEFTGATGAVSFDANYDRIGVYDILNQQGTGFTDIGNWDKNDGLKLDSDIVWASGYTPPKTKTSDSPSITFYLAFFSLSFVALYMRRMRKN